MRSQGLTGRMHVKAVQEAVKDVEKIELVVEMEASVVENEAMAVQMKGWVVENEVMRVQKQ